MLEPDAQVARSILIVFSMSSESIVRVLTGTLIISHGPGTRGMSSLYDAAVMLSASDARTAREGLFT